jgi:hypothetical protein
MLLQFPTGVSFATGATTYLYQPATSFETDPPIILRVFLGSLETFAFIDTGGVNLICPPQIGIGLGLYPEDSLGVLRILLRGIWYTGHLHRLPLTFPADYGEALGIGVTAFVPQLEAGLEWPDDFPCILGMGGCLERLRFAVDPLTDTFYFGDLAM